jgi:hypothetical protein
MQKNSSASPLAPLRAAIHPQASKPWGFLADFDKVGPDFRIGIQSCFYE